MMAHHEAEGQKPSRGWQIPALSGLILGAMLYLSGRTELHGDLMAFRNSITSLKHPYWARWFFALLSWMPEKAAFWVLGALNVSGLALAVREFRGRYWITFTSFAFFWILAYGQIDGLVIGGIALASKGARAKNPWMLGSGLTIASMKPQLSLFLGLYLWRRAEDIRWRSLWIPLSVLLLSILEWGWWIPEWMSRIRDASHLIRLSRNLSWFPQLGIWVTAVWLLVLWKWKDLPMARKIISISISTILTVPYFPLPSVLLLLVQPVPWWVWAWTQIPVLAGFGMEWTYALAHWLPWAVLIWAMWL